MSASSRVLIDRRTAPAIGTPWWASSIAGVFDSITATVSPRFTPRRSMAEPSWRERR